MDSVTCRTEYLTSRHEWGARGAWIALVAGLLAFVALKVVGVSGSTTALVVFGAVAVSLTIAAWGRLGARGAMLLAVNGETVTLGNEGKRLTSYPLSTLVSVSREGPASATSQSGQNLTVAGLNYLVLEFSDGVTPDRSTDIWQIAVVETDPAATVLLDRLRPASASSPVNLAKPFTPDAYRDTSAPNTSRRASATPRVDLSRETSAAVSDTGYDDPRIANASSDEAAQRLWESATGRHDEILRAYGAYELQPEQMLRYPAVTDVTLEPVQDFHDALSDAQALRSESFPDEREVADDYQQSVRRLSRAWIACEANGRKLGTEYLGTDERDGLDTALKLVSHARGSATGEEEAAYYQRAHRIVVDLRDKGAIHLPAGAVAQLEASARRALK
ncbi:hypothetical protein GOEFS_105_00590 [Gordonia effusa NBRC 100432]|uniref:Uncharacterized protein n=1 Tax=Gordonia effusa NBRC 100432 TaxID=1077974 RepID=H0R4P7_9ACTN|nr:hypothetical protein [Gordonia effusa]GAB20048.1 hypothetical protein GOEFS_105_00590 [Gordonia effusa NBRC 100432]